jgi:hypothetical protein
MGLIRCPETSVKDYHSTLRNTPEECRSDSKYCYAMVYPIIGGVTKNARPLKFQFFFKLAGVGNNPSKWILLVDQLLDLFVSGLFKGYS